MKNNLYSVIADVALVISILRWRRIVLPNAGILHSLQVSVLVLIIIFLAQIKANIKYVLSPP